MHNLLSGHDSGCVRFDRLLKALLLSSGGRGRAVLEKVLHLQPVALIPDGTYGYGDTTQRWSFHFDDTGKLKIEAKASKVFSDPWPRVADEFASLPNYETLQR